MKIIIESDTMFITEGFIMNNIKPIYYKSKLYIPFKIYGIKPENNVVSVNCICKSNRRKMLIPLCNKLNISFRKDIYIAFIESI